MSFYSEQSKCQRQRGNILRAVALLALLLSVPACNQPAAPASPSTQTVQSVMVEQLGGQKIDALQVTNAKAQVFLFVTTDCPISNRYAPEVRRIYEEFAPQGVQFRLVYADADTTPEQIQKHLKDFSYPMEAVRDPQHALVNYTGARVTPEAAVLLPDGRKVYGGRIDNWYEDFGKRRPEPTQYDLREVLKSILAGQPVTVESSPAIGCYIPD